MTSHRTTPRTRRLITVIAAGITLSLTPLPTLTTSVHAEAPAANVTGLARGARGDAVRDVQQALVDQGVTVAGGVDGIFGSGTEAALKQFQGRHGLVKTGKVDLATAIALGLEESKLLGLTQGNRGERVATLQRTLSAAGFEPIGGADGIFGPGTNQALKDFQAARGFLPTGTVNAATAAALAGVDTANGSNGSSSNAADTRAADTASDTSNDDAATDPGADSVLVGLKIGSRGDLVKRIQNALMDAGFTVVGGADGIYGVLTASAVKSFQNANGIAVTGKINAATAALIEHVESDSHAGHDHGDEGHEADEHDPTVDSPFVGLQYGSLGADVKQLQQALLDAGITVRGGADGVFGPATRAAVKDFQARHDLNTTGKVNTATANALASRNPAGAASPLVGLKAGALGNTVKQLQQAMLDAGVDVRGGADGIFGPATAQALKTFQTSQGIEATGVVDAATAAALDDPQPIAADGGDDYSAGGSDGSDAQVELGYAVYGEKGARVTALQTALVEAGIALRGGVDGDFGGGTSAAVMEFQRQNGLSVSGKVNAATAEALGLEAAPAPTAADPASVELQYFPVQGRCYFGDSWGYPRSGGRVHLGVDIIAAEGKLIYAVADGTIEKIYTDRPGSLAGNGVRLRMDDGTYFFYAHMSELAEGIELGVPVRAGKVLGLKGSTGNSGTPHLHFEIHPQGGSAVNPYPYVKAIDGCGNTEPLGLG